MIKPKLITFTGVDERTDIKKLVALSVRYPVEWGVLFSKANTGKVNRYPSHAALDQLLRVRMLRGKWRLSAHICGRWSRDILEHGIIDPALDILKGRFVRTQINVADGETDVDLAAMRVENGATFAKAIGANKAIIQCRDQFPQSSEVNWLYDRSGGAGELPATWDAGAFHSGAFCGYAGGIGPENVEDVLTKISWTHPSDKPYWIDMEGRVRDENDWFDLNRVEAVLWKVYGSSYTVDPVE